MNIFFIILIAAACIAETILCWYQNYFKVQRVFDPPPFRWSQSNLPYYTAMSVLSFVMTAVIMVGFWLYFDVYASFAVLAIIYLVDNAFWSFNFKRERSRLADIFYRQICTSLSGNPADKLHNAIAEYNSGVSTITEEMRLWNEDQLRSESLKRADEWIQVRMDEHKKLFS